MTKQSLKQKLLKEFNSLAIPDMHQVTELYEHKGSFVNLEYTLPGGQVVKFWDDEKTYYGNQICKDGSNRCYGLVADENNLMVCEYGDNGTDAEIIVYNKTLR